MKIRRYIGKDTHEALLKVKMDLGNDAVILNTRKIRQKGLLKIFQSLWLRFWLPWMTIMEQVPKGRLMKVGEETKEVMIPQETIICIIMRVQKVNWTKKRKKSIC
ncbi:flagellar biosynthesis protein FlhF [Acetivibrio straminisolvens JCM 21531]|uniref:Flagellar biosynthesis protein FlhF n=1 Tax=Acetivibrio straminisolvens JCM 21531 TaxID=1294263 RepID=W4V852_9FIRM|nr:flagellar biosynthesis protein FlhF [Acetivibrio straminisolvens JCM 21531]